MIYGKIVDGALEYAPPEIYNDNNEVVVFDTLDKYLEYGYKQVINSKPVYNNVTHKLLFDGVIEDSQFILIKYTIKPISVIQQFNIILEEEVNE